MRTPITIIAGPTASGKSALAIQHAQDHPSTIINADSMQVYAGLPILTAQPLDRLDIPHVLYGHRPIDQVYSAAAWVQDAITAIHDCQRAGRQPLLVGGTGLYINALVHGFSPIPDIPKSIRNATRSLMAEIGPQAFYQELAKKDPLTAAKLQPTDRQRLCRAWEVWEATGTPLATWQQVPPIKHHDFEFKIILVDPPKADLNANIEKRLQDMVDQGVVKEVADFATSLAGRTSPLEKAVGYREFLGHVHGKYSLDEALELAILATRQYAKRQRTWFRWQLKDNLMKSTLKGE